MTYTITDGILQLTVTDQGGTMTSLVYLPTGEERLWQGGEAWKSSDVVIFPIIGHADAFEVAGKPYELKSHGLVRYTTLACTAQTANSVTLSTSSNVETLKQFPYEYDFSITYTVENGTLTVSYHIVSKHGKMPFYVGGHPGMSAPGGSAVIEFATEQSPLCYPIGEGRSTRLEHLKQFVADKPFFAECATFQLGEVQGDIYAHTQDGYTYTYSSSCPLWAFWSNPTGGDYVCVEPWWGINDYPSAPREFSLKPFINYDDGTGKTFFYQLKIQKD